METQPKNNTAETLFSKIKQIVYIGMTAISLYMLHGINEQMKINRDYEAATQNVTNRFIGMLEGQGQTQCGEKVLDYIQTIEKEKQIKKGQF